MAKAVHELTRVTDILNTIYSVGSIYLDTSGAAVCPIQAAGIGTWTSEGSSLVTGSSSISVNIWKRTV